ncbi:MAG: DUF4494 family protein [Clostridia bacterium]|nr:DUF4494 family protein [Clostridia bacterium]
MKKNQRIESGFAVEDADLNPALFDFQKYCVKRALAVGKFALFEDCGLGKTIQQLEWAQKVFEHTDQPVLILAPLAVISQTIKEGSKFGYKVMDYDEMMPNNIDECGIFITNYDNLPNVEVSSFGGIVLDESSILKNFQGKTRTYIIEQFKRTPYKLACTATPSPNDTTEICNHAEFLDEKSGAEKRKAFYCLVQASDLRAAVKRLDEGMKGSMADYEIVSIAETNIFDVFNFKESETA